MEIIFGIILFLMLARLLRYWWTLFETRPSTKKFQFSIASPLVGGSVEITKEKINRNRESEKEVMTNEEI